MRDDMDRVLIERPRIGHSLPNVKSRWHANGYDPDKHDDQPKLASMSRHVVFGYSRGGGKEFSDHLGPLKRFLMSSVGRPWDSVHSEIKKALKPNLCGQHLMSHVMGYVETECYEGQDRLIYETRTGRPVEGLYVHPRNGLLLNHQRLGRKKLRVIAAAKRFKESTEVQVNGHWYVKRHGCWFKAERREKFYWAYRPVAVGSTVLRYEVVKTGEYEFKWTKQLNKRELRDLRGLLP